MPATASRGPGDRVTEATRHQPVVEPAESERDRLERLLKFVARQEPGLRWAVGTREDGTTLLVTDLAHGWIPPGITLPADVRLLEPGRRTGTATVLLGQTTLSAKYAPGDPLGWASDYEVTDTSSQPRELPDVDDLGWVLGEATHWRDGLPRMVNTLAKAGAAGTGVVDAEIDVLRVYLDTSRYQLLAQYPDIDAGPAAELSAAGRDRRYRHEESGQRELPLRLVPVAERATGQRLESRPVTELRCSSLRTMN